MPEKNWPSIPLLVALMAFAIVAFTPQIFNDGDTFLHVAAGERMLAEHAILFRDPFSYTFFGRPWLAHEWLAEIFMALAYGWGGWAGISLLSASAMALTAFFFTRHLGRFLPPGPQLLTVAVALACTAPSLLARPHLLALPALELWTAGLVIARSRHRAPSWLLLPLMTLWANLHGGFIIGFFLLACLGAEAVVVEGERRESLKSWALFSLGAILAALVTPHFADGLLFPFKLAGTTALGNVGEWQPANFSTLQPFELAILAGIYLLASRGIRLPAGRIAISLVLLHLALQHMRHQMIFAIAVPLILAEPIAHALGWKSVDARPAARAAWNAAFAVLALAVCVARLALPYRGGAAVAPEAALARVPDQLRAAPVLNDYSFGGYLIFRGVRPFIDSRAELYGDAFLANYARIVRPDAGAIGRTLDTYRIEWTIFAPESPAVTVLDLLPGWRRAYADKVAVIHVRMPAR